ncbi:hypothetical protein BBJ28_00020569 [Nothophytophthora sp. Chile5]|nr:hypothetical protein BBJ28_00020569 [Nothophytophthora sp. Chile5]
MADTKKTVLITGSTRSIGLALAQHYTKEGWNVIGTKRANSNTDQLEALSPFKTVVLDAGDEASILETARQLEGVPIDLLINNAGICMADGLASATKDAFMRQFEVNAVGPFLVTRALLPNLELAVKANGSATVAHVSSLLGSISFNTSENVGFFSQGCSYATSKTALNMVTRCMFMELSDSNILFVTLNPGYVDTDMNQHQGYLKPSESVEGMANIIAKLSPEDSGKFFSADAEYPGPALQCSIGTPLVQGSALTFTCTIWRTLFTSQVPGSFAYVAAMEWVMYRLRRTYNIVAAAFIARILAEQLDETVEDEEDRAFLDQQLGMTRGPQ